MTNARSVSRWGMILDFLMTLTTAHSEDGYRSTRRQGSTDQSGRYAAPNKRRLAWFYGKVAELVGGGGSTKLCVLLAVFLFF